MMNEETKVSAECRPCKIKAFFEREHTPLEKGMMVAAGVVTGIVIGLAISQVQGGIEVSIGSHNGCGNHHNGCENTELKKK